MSIDKLFEKIEELYPKYVKVWEDVCKIESPTHHKAGVDAVGRYFIDMAEEKGWQVEVSEQAVSGNAVCITINPESTEAPVCFSGHMDTVHPIGLFPDPIVTMDETNIYGPGVNDCKGGCVASFLALDALAQTGYKKRPVKLILQSDEETSSKESDKKTVEFMCEKAKDAVAFFNAEGHSKGEITMQRKGILRFCLTVTGKAVHSAKCYEGVSAIAEAAHKLIELESMKDPNGLTCNCGVIGGGTVANTVAESCSFEADIRFSNSEEEREARRRVKEVAQKTWLAGCTCEVKEVSYRPAMEYSEKNYALLDKMNEIYTQVGLPTLKPVIRNGGSDTAFTTQAGIPCVDSIGVAGDGIHSSNEKAELKSLILSAQYLASAAMYL